MAVFKYMVKEDNMKNNIVLQVPGIFFRGNDSHQITQESLNNLCSYISRLLDNKFNVFIDVGSDNFLDLITYEDIEFPREIKDFIVSRIVQINSIILFQELHKKQIPSKVLFDKDDELLSDVEVYSPQKAMSYLEKSYVVIGSVGVEHGLHIEDFSAAVRTVELRALALCKLLPFDYFPQVSQKALKMRGKQATQLGDFTDLPIAVSALAFCHQHNIPVVLVSPQGLDELSSVLQGNEDHADTIALF
jgi:uridylate kinase